MVSPRLLLLATVALLACTSATVLRLDPTPRPRTHPDSIQLIGQEPQRPYTVIAIVSARSEMNMIGTSRLEQSRGRLLKEAARLGGHAVLFDFTSLKHELTGKVIVYTDSSHSN